MVDFAQSPLLFFKTAAAAGALVVVFLPLVAASVAAADAAPRLEPPPLAIASVDGRSTKNLGSRTMEAEREEEEEGTRAARRANGR